LAQVKTEYAFWLDADEVLQDPQAIRTMLQRAHGQAFSMWVMSPLPDGRQFPMYQPRLFPVTPGVFFECPVFERIDWSLDDRGIRIVNTEYAPIFHPGYTNINTLREKRKRNLRILEKASQNFVGGERQANHLFKQYMNCIGA
jgi:hypothetical protein